MPSRREDRIHDLSVDDRRTRFQRDRDRILYSSAFKRLSSVTQVVAASEGHVFHNRMTHSLKVAQIARRLVEKFRRDQPEISQALGLDPDVAEAAALAHDLGHPPFGHVAEERLDAMVRECGVPEGFEGNAQSYRIIATLALRRPDHPGLDLTLATLNAVLKYPWLRHVPDDQGGKRWRKFGAYHTERLEFDRARSLGPEDGVRSVEAQIMDWADDIAYAVHDIEDFYRAGLIPLDLLGRPHDEPDRFLDWVASRWNEQGRGAEALDDIDSDETRRAFTASLGLFAVLGPYRGSREQRAQLRQNTAVVIADLVTNTVLKDDLDPGDDALDTSDSNFAHLVPLLKELVWYYVIERPALATQQAGKSKIVATVFEAFYDAVFGQQTRTSLLPLRSQDELELLTESHDELPLDYRRTRVIADSVASLGEDELVRLYGRLTGHDLGSVLEHVT